MIKCMNIWKPCDIKWALNLCLTLIAVGVEIIDWELETKKISLTFSKTKSNTSKYLLIFNHTFRKI